MATRTCKRQGCDNPIVRRSYESDQQFESRQFCCVPCKNSFAGSRSPWRLPFKESLRRKVLAEQKEQGNAK